MTKANGFAACYWSKFNWIEGDDVIYMCQAPFDGASECAAEDDSAADREDLDTGCNGFGWSILTAK